MKIYHLAAMAEDRTIGKNGGIPWDIPEDLQRFKEITIGHAVIMGRKTFQSLPSPLSRRLNLVLTRQEEIEKDGFKLSRQDGIISMKESARTKLCSSVSEAFRFCSENEINEIYIIGGQSVYKQTLKYADELRLTVVHQEVEQGDTFYPNIEQGIKDWEASFIEPHEKYSFVDYVPKNPNS